jgi:hypothetical protein
MNKIIQCPNKECNKSAPFSSFKILHYSVDNIDKLGHFHLKCDCGAELNVWEEDGRVKQIFGPSYKLYQ